MGNILFAFGEAADESARVLPVALPVLLVVYYYIYIRFGGCLLFILQLRSEIMTEILGYPPEPSAPPRSAVTESPSNALHESLLPAVATAAASFAESMASVTRHGAARHPPAPPASSAEPAPPGAPTCPVCLVNLPNAALDCGHRVCAACLAHIQRGRPPGLCPICREVIHEVLRLYN